MARAFNAIQQNYIGVPYTRAIQYKGQQAQLVILQLFWINYGASTTNSTVNVFVDFKNSLVATPLGRIRSVYIDNMGSDVPIYVYCQDTGYAVVAEPNSAGWFRLFTNQMSLNIVGQGFVTGDVPVTAIYVSNIETENFIDIEIAQSQTLYKASNTITRGTSVYQANFGIPALGDQFLNSVVSKTITNAVLFGGPQASGFWYISAFTVYAFFPDVSTGVPFVGSAAFRIVSSGVSGILATGSTFLASFSTAGIFTVIIQPNPIITLTGMNIKLDATQQWLFQATSPASMSSNTELILNMCFTFNPS